MLLPLNSLRLLLSILQILTLALRAFLQFEASSLEEAQFKGRSLSVLFHSIYIIGVTLAPARLLITIYNRFQSALAQVRFRYLSYYSRLMN
jgi:hypothetical protein